MAGETSAKPGGQVRLGFLPSGWGLVSLGVVAVVGICSSNSPAGIQGPFPEQAALTPRRPGKDPGVQPTASPSCLPILLLTLTLPPTRVHDAFEALTHVEPRNVRKRRLGDHRVKALL